MADNTIRTVTATLAMFQAIPSLAAAAASEGQNLVPSTFPSGATPPFPFPTGPSGMPVGGPDGAMGPGSMEGPPGGPEDLGPPPILTAPQMAGVEWALVAFTLCLLAMRIYFRIYMTRTIKWSDGFAITGWISFLIWVSFETELLRNGFYGFGFLEDAVIIRSLKLIFIQPIFYFLTVYSIKGAMLCFYNELLARTTRTRMIIILRILGGLCVIGFLYTNLFNILVCRPIETNWSIDPNAQCKSLPSLASAQAATIIQFLFHLLTDLMIYIFPIFILRGMVLPLRKKIDAGIMFAIGFFTLVNAALYFVFSMFFFQDVGRVKFAQTWEMAFAVTLACAPSLKVFWVQKVGPQVRKVSQGFSSLTTKSSRRRGSGDEDDDLEKQNGSGRFLGISRPKRVSVSEIRLVTLEEQAVRMV